MDDLLRLDRQNIDSASETLTRAFRDNALFQYAYPDKSFRMRILPHYFRMLLYYAVRWGEVYATSTTLEGVAAWIKSDYSPTIGRTISAVPISVINAFLRAGMSSFKKAVSGNVRLRRPGNEISTIHKRHAPFEHWFLMVVGVAPQFQGKGHAGKLLIPMLERIYGDGLPCYTDTQEERNVSLYERLGFRVVEKRPIHGTGLTTGRF